MDGNKFETLHTGPLCGESLEKPDSNKKEADFIASSGGVNVDLLFAGRRVNVRHISIKKE